MPVQEKILSKQKEKLRTPIGVLSFLVAGAGFEPHDLRVMSPTSYQAALPRDIYTSLSKCFAIIHKLYSVVKHFIQNFL